MLVGKAGIAGESKTTLSTSPSSRRYLRPRPRGRWTEAEADARDCLDYGGEPDGEAYHALALALATALWGCGTDCDDAAGKLAFCELPTPSSLAGDCDDEGTLACQARCVRDTSCVQIARSMAGDETDFDRCAAACGAGDLFAA